MPAVRAVGRDALVATWNLENGPNPEAYDLYLAQSSDDGQTWTAPKKAHDDSTATQHGFASLFPTANGGFGLAWLDGRSTNADSGEGDMALFAGMFDATGARTGSAAAIDTRVCECCPLASAVTSEGPIVAFRNRSDAEVRDIYVSRLADGRWSSPIRVHADEWTIRACPVNGPSIAAHGREVVVGWFTAAGGDGRSYAAFSDDGGRTFGPPIRVDDTSSLGRMQAVLLPDGAAAVSWTEFADHRSSLAVRRITRDGNRSPAVTLAQEIGTQYPRLAADGDGVVAAWVTETPDATQVVTAHVSIDHR